ncbi:hypothetical protein OSB04_014183 [Centaurea solstitialis]|uniref:Uncharacterized protein n=1 Tax=Centaurea solstitialis TaxID=347529 RepID=A0AA38SWV0_9ASTR|nr:hypothetical protein OSB04_014183 [Centaurea solstitialis]
MLRGQAQILRYLYGIFDGMALRCCVELRIADIISNHGRPATLSEIAASIDSVSINMDGLGRLMKFLVYKNVFDEVLQPEKGKGEGEKAYSLNYCSQWLLIDTNVTLAPMVRMRTDPSMIFNEGMACTAKITIDAILSKYKNGFLGLKGSIVDVGGGTGVAISEIVKTYPHLKGINFDLSHVIFTAPTYDGVTHVAGNMFKAIPRADTIFMKWILHDWSDEDCIKILKNCRKALLKKTGKIIIVEIVQHSTEDDLFQDTHLTYDLVMFSHFSSGKERTESEWKKLLDEGGFSRYNIIKIHALQSIIEAFP